ncbi:MAG: hypothetical protein NZM37_06200 [Sandaracinaceae bacterium]|nr:hypothetical protein [Sandaracinaceae bacterium]MDW8245488.1 hypothetical protein [Sandaracinaceae bacterium]
MEPPRFGVRIAIELIDDMGESARFRIKAATSKQSVEGVALISPKEIQIEFPVEIEDWVMHHARNFLESIRRNRKEGTKWPRKILRWRDVPRGEGGD